MAMSEKQKAAALAAARAPARRRMNADYEILSKSLKAFHVILRRDLLAEDFRVGEAKGEAGCGDHSLSTRYRLALGMTPKTYHHQWRLSIAECLLRDFNFPVGAAAAAVGITDLAAFSRVFKEWSGERPSDVRGQKLPPFADYATYHELCRGTLSYPEGRRALAPFLRLYPDPEAADPPPPVDDGPARERRRAEDTWQQMREKPFAKQERVVRYEFFRSRVFFDLLRRQSRREGRRDRRAGVRLAELALASLDGCGEALGERRADFRAEALADLGNARRLASDRAGSEAEFVAAWAAWRSPRSAPDPRVGPKISVLQGTLRMSQRRNDEALQLTEDALRGFREIGDVKGQVGALIQRAAVHGYMDRLEAAQADLEEASTLSAQVEDPLLRFHVEYNLANVAVRRGRNEEAREALTQLRATLQGVDYPGGTIEIQHLEGNVREGLGDYRGAEECYRAAQDGFAKDEAWRGAALAEVDLAVVFARQGKHEEVIELVSRLIPVLESQELHPETLAAVRLLAAALAETKITHGLLCHVRAKMRQDPLFCLA